MLAYVTETKTAQNSDRANTMFPNRVFNRRIPVACLSDFVEDKRNDTFIRAAFALCYPIFRVRLSTEKN